MNIHEYQAKAVLREFGVPVPRGIPAFSVDEAEKAANELGGPVWVVKAQIHAGGRGKAGGVKVVKSVDDVKKEATRLLGSTLVTHQTGPHGKQVSRLYIEEGSAIDQRVLSVDADRPRDLARRLRGLDRRRHGYRRGGAQHAGQDRDHFDRSGRPAFMPHHVRTVAHALGLTPISAKQLGPLLPQALQGVHRHRHEPARDQSAGRHQGRAS